MKLFQRGGFQRSASGIRRSVRCHDALLATLLLHAAVATDRSSRRRVRPAKKTSVSAPSRIASVVLQANIKVGLLRSAGSSLAKAWLDDCRVTPARRRCSRRAAAASWKRRAFARGSILCAPLLLRFCLDRSPLPMNSTRRERGLREGDDALAGLKEKPSRRSAASLRRR